MTEKATGLRGEAEATGTIRIDGCLAEGAGEAGRMHIDTRVIIDGDEVIIDGPITGDTNHSCLNEEMFETKCIVLVEIEVLRDVSMANVAEEVVDVEALVHGEEVVVVANLLVAVSTHHHLLCRHFF
jgi:hypothetical protein